MEIGSDLITEVLSRLPVKPLLRFKCVSKDWDSIISGISFRRRHCRRLKATISGYLLRDEYNLIKYVSLCGNQITMQPLNLDFLPQKVEIVASSNGLLCCRTHYWDADIGIYVCNPVTKEYVKIEWPENDSIRDYISIGIICDPVLCPTSFKLVKINRGIDSPNVFRIYVSETRQWRTIKDAQYHDVYVNNSIFASGMLYWMTDGNVILAFDIEKEESQLIYLPDRRVWWHYDTPACSSCFGESGGRLHYICVTDSTLQAWALDGDFKWVLKHSISLAVIGEENPCFLYNETEHMVPQFPLITPTWIEPLAFMDRLFLVRICSTFCGESKIERFQRIYYHHFDTRKTEELCNRHVNLPLNKLLRALPYNMSLVPVGCA